MALPQYYLEFQEAKQNEDVSAMAIVHNLNMEAIVDYINAIKDYVASLGNSGGTLTQAQFNALLQSSKNNVMLLAGMTNGQTIDFNSYRLTRLGVPVGYPSSAIEFRITDTDINRNTNFQLMSVFVQSYDGQLVNPLIVSKLSYISIIFLDSTDVAATQATQATDPNNKRITIF